MRLLLSLIGLAAVLMGLLWIGQGLGYVKWPASSFMISQIQWAYYGCGLALIGFIILSLSRR